MRIPHKAIRGDWRLNRYPLRRHWLRTAILKALRKYRYGRTEQQLAEELEVTLWQVKHHMRILCERHKVWSIGKTEHLTRNVTIWSIRKKKDVRRRLQTKRNRSRIRTESFARSTDTKKIEVRP